MPLYEYKCELCGREEEMLQKFTDPPPEVCEGCGAVDSLGRKIGGQYFSTEGWWLGR